MKRIHLPIVNGVFDGSDVNFSVLFITPVVDCASEVVGSVVFGSNILVVKGCVIKDTRTVCSDTEVVIAVVGFVLGVGILSKTDYLTS